VYQEPHTVYNPQSIWQPVPLHFCWHSMESVRGDRCKPSWKRFELIAEQVHWCCSIRRSKYIYTHRYNCVCFLGYSYLYDYWWRRRRVNRISNWILSRHWRESEADYVIRSMQMQMQLQMHRQLKIFRCNNSHSTRIWNGTD